MIPQTASCCCRACTVTVDGPATFNALCHCANCKRRTGGPFGWSVYFREEQVSAPTGPLKTWVIEGEKAQTRWFCADCGTTLLWRASFLPGVGIAAGCFEGEPFGSPAISSTDAQRCAWVTLPQGVRLLP